MKEKTYALKVLERHVLQSIRELIREEVRWLFKKEFKLKKSVGVFMTSREEAVEYFENLISEARKRDIFQIMKQRLVVEFKDGTRYKIIVASGEAMRGSRFDEMLISKRVTRNYVNSVILPYSTSDSIKYLG